MRDLPSRAGFVRCTSCRRHVRPGPCPFCSGNRVSVAARNLGRGSVVAASLFAAACGGTQSEATPEPDPDTTEQSEDPIAEPAYGIPPDELPPPEEEGATPDRPPDPPDEPMYGVPPEEL
ncbi:MAG: hypothetical protein AAGF12_15065 [Myxococcota bacterium]